MHRGSSGRSGREGQLAERSGRAIRSSTGSTAEAGAVEDARSRPSIGQDGRLDEVLAIILVGARDVAGQREAGQAGDRHVGRAADAELVHPAAPDRHAARRQTSWTRFASRSPPTRLTLMLITRQAPRSSALRASSAEWMLSSRQTGVFRPAWSRAWSMMSSCASGCSISSRSNASSRFSVGRSSSV